MSNVKEKLPATNGLSRDDDAISRRLVHARTSAEPLSGFPGQAPVTLDQAYAIQAASIARWPDPVAGWKVGLLSAEDQQRHGSERLAGPIFRSQIHAVVNEAHMTMPVFVGGFAAIEAEFVFRLGQTIRPDTADGWTDGSNDGSTDRLLDAVAGLHIGAELASSPIADINSLGATVVVADFGNNAGLLLGPEIPNWHQLAPPQLPAKVVINGDVVGEASAAAIPGGPFAALQFAVATAASRNIELPAGTLISTGAATGVHDIDVTSTSRIEFGEYGWFDVTFEPMTDQQ